MANAGPFSDPVAISRNTANSLGVEMIDLRRGLGGLSTPQAGNTFGTTTGVFPGGTTGAGPSNDLGFSGSSGLTVNFNAGQYGVDRGAGNLFLGMAYSGWSVVLDSGDAVNPRIDMVCIRVRDPAGLDTPGTGITQSAFPVILKGTPAASPVKPTAQLTNGDLPLWSFTVGGGSNANTVIASTDERLFIEARGAIRTRRGIDTRAGAYEGQVAYNTDTRRYEGWDGAAWTQWGSLTGWQTYTPQLYSGGNGFGSGSFLCNLGNGPIYRGRYQVIGKRLDISVVIVGGSGTHNMGTGIVNSLLPAGLVARPQIGGDVRPAQQFYANLVTTQGYSYPGQAGVRDGSNVIALGFPLGEGNTRLGAYTVTSDGAQGKGIPLVGAGDGTGMPNVNILAFTGFLEIS